MKQATVTIWGKLVFLTQDNDGSVYLESLQRQATQEELCNPEFDPATLQRTRPKHTHYQGGAI